MGESDPPTCDGLEGGASEVVPTGEAAGGLRVLDTAGSAAGLSTAGGVSNADTASVYQSTMSHEADTNMAIVVVPAKDAQNGEFAADDDPRVDPLASCFPKLHFMVQMPVVPDAAERIKPGRLLNMLPFKVWVRHSMIAAEIDNGFSRVWLCKHPLTSNDFVLDPERVAKAKIIGHRFIRCVFFSTMIQSASVVFTTVLAMYLSLLEYTVDEDGNTSLLWGSIRAADGLLGTLQAILFVFTLSYPIITTWLVFSVAFEQMMRREVYYVLMHFKILLDFQNLSWTSGKRFATSKFEVFFVYWVLVGGVIMVAYAIAQRSGWLNCLAVAALYTVPLALWLSSIMTQEWSTVPLNKFFEMKRDAGEGMDVQTGVKFLSDCTAVPEATFRGVAAHVASGSAWSSLWSNCCPCFLSDPKVEKEDPVPNFIDKLKKEGQLWWEKRAAYSARNSFPPNKDDKVKSCVPCVKANQYAKSRWGTVLMKQVLPYTADLAEIHHLIRQYNCWAGTTWVILLFIMFGLELWTFWSFTRGAFAGPDQCAGSNSTNTNCTATNTTN